MLIKNLCDFLLTVQKKCPSFLHSLLFLMRLLFLQLSAWSCTWSWSSSKHCAPCLAFCRSSCWKTLTLILIILSSLTYKVYFIVCVLHNRTTTTFNGKASSKRFDQPAAGILSMWPLAIRITSSEDLFWFVEHHQYHAIVIQQHCSFVRIAKCASQ